MSFKLKELRDLSDEEIIKEHDKTSDHTMVGVAYFLDELARREQSRETDKIILYTKQILVLTIIVTIATIINVFIAWK